MCKEKQKVTLASYDNLVLTSKTAQNIHNNIIRYNDAFDRNTGELKDFIEISGCETPIFMVLEDTHITFICRSKVLRSYIFCLLINYIDDSEFNFDTLVTKYGFANILTPQRREALRNLYDLIVKIDFNSFKKRLTMHKYQIG